jgi:hypothetical protein
MRGNLMTLKMTEKSLTQRCRRIATCALLNVSLAAGAATLDSVHFDDTLHLAQADLQLNGMGLRRMLFVKVYAAGLYLPRKADSLEAVAAQMGPKRLQLHMLHAATPDDFIGALVPGMRDNTPQATQDALAGRIAQLEATIRGIGKTVPGDVIDFDYAPDSGTRVAVNGAAKGPPITGADFYAAVLAIFVGPRPVDGSLKKGLLGQP